MMNTADTGRNRGGFTLMEVIVTIMAAGILAAFFVHFMGTSLSSASDSVARVLAESGGEATVERIIADYVLEMNSGSPAGTLNTIKTRIDSNLYNNAAIDDVTAEYIEFDSGGNVVTVTPGPTTTLQVTVEVEGNDQMFLLGQARTAGAQPLINY